MVSQEEGDLRVQEWEEDSTHSQEEEVEQEDSQLDSHSGEVKVEDSHQVTRMTSLRVSLAVWEEWGEWVVCREWEVCRAEEEVDRDEKLLEETPLRRWEVEGDSQVGLAEVWEWISMTTTCREVDQHRRNPLQKSVSSSCLADFAHSRPRY